MSTKPLESVLYREISALQAKEKLVIALPLLEELVNYGTNVLIRCSTSPTTNEKNVDNAPLSLYRHILESTDALTILLANGACDPSISILRSAYEALLSLEYIVEKSEYYKNRSLQWLANYIRIRIRSYNLLLKDHPINKQFTAQLEKDKVFPFLSNYPHDTIPQNELKRAIDNLQSLLNSEQFIPIQTEFATLKKNGVRNPKWYSFFDGPKNLEGLASYLQKSFEYEVFYRYWSRISHAQDFSKFIDASPERDTGVKQIRDTSTILEYAGRGADFIIEATRLILKKFRPGEDFSIYYKNNIQSRYLGLRKNPRFTNSSKNSP